MQLLSTTDAAAKGSRDYQEDRHFTSEHTDGILLAVFDGHGGSESSHEAMRCFDRLFWASLEFFNGDPKRALHDSVKQLAVRLADWESGSTLSVAYIPTEGSRAFTAVLGDSPIIIHDGLTTWTGPDHNVRTNPAEREAAEARGGYCDGSYLYRNMHSQGLQMARALGDSHLKGVLSTEPEINEVPIVGSGFILVATDGLFDPSHRNGFEASKKILLAAINEGVDAQYLVDYAIGQDTGDNATAILARF
jgi:serine/threonine protein phosphatase PrpC